MSYIIVKDKTMLAKGGVPVTKRIYLRRTNSGTWVASGKGNFHRFENREIAESILQLWNNTDRYATDGTWTVIEEEIK